MKQRKLAICLAVPFILFIMSGCNKNKIETVNPEVTPDRIEQESSVEESITDKKSDTEAESPEGLFARAFNEGQIENNGGMFVRVANRVYYRVYSPRALELTVIGFPRVSEVDANPLSKLKYYDLDTDKSVEVCELKGIGNLYATVDGICIDSYPDGFHSTTCIDENGEINEHYLDGNITGVSDDGRSVVISESDDNDRMVPCMYRDGKRIGVPTNDGSKSGFGPLGFAGNSLILNGESDSSGTDSIYSYDEKGELNKLGDIAPLDMETYTLSPIIEEMTPDGDGGYIVVSFRDGTANALAGWKVYSFTSASAGSLEVFDEGDPEEKFNFEYPRITVNDEDVPILSMHKAGEVYLSENTYGDLKCAVPGGTDITIMDNFVYEQDEHLTYVTQVEQGHCFDNSAAFFLEVRGERSPDEDIGWRWAYELSNVDYRLFRFDDEHKDNNGRPMSDTLEYLSSAGWSEGEIEYERLVGEWKADSYNVEGEFRIAEENNGVNDEMIRFDEDGNALIYFKDRASGKTSNERPMHQAGPDDFMGGDYAYFFHSEDEDPLRAGVAYLSHDVLKMYYLYHFDGGSTGWYEIRYKRANE